MFTNLTYLAATSAAGTENADLFASLGIDWKMLVLQSIAFLILLGLLSKFVFPVLVKMIDDREAKIAEGQKAAEEATKQAENAKDDVAQLLKDARKEAAEVVATAKDQANKTLVDSDAKAKERAERIVASAHDDIAKEIDAARQTLRNDTLELVALATEKIAGSAVSKSIDQKQIETAIKDVK